MAYSLGVLGCYTYDTTCPMLCCLTVCMWPTSVKCKITCECTVHMHIVKHFACRVRNTNQKYALRWTLNAFHDVALVGSQKKNPATYCCVWLKTVFVHCTWFCTLVCVRPLLMHANSCTQILSSAQTCTILSNTTSTMHPSAFSYSVRGTQCVYSMRMDLNLGNAKYEETLCDLNENVFCWELSQVVLLYIVDVK